MCVWVRVNVHVWKPECQVTPNHYPPCIFETESFTEPGAQIWLDWLTSELQGSFCLHAYNPALGLETHTLYLAFYLGSRDPIQVLVVMWQVLYWWSLLAPQTWDLASKTVQKPLFRQISPHHLRVLFDFICVCVCTCTCVWSKHVCRHTHVWTHMWRPE